MRYYFLGGFGLGVSFLGGISAECFFVPVCGLDAVSFLAMVIIF
jgi:hypothetical protein